MWFPSLVNKIRKEGKFKNRRDWYEIYDMMKTEGIYYPNPKAGYNIQNIKFKRSAKISTPRKKGDFLFFILIFIFFI